MTPAATAPPAAPARRFTPEQRAAVADRDGSSLLAAGAGSGKTAVMVERFVEAVRLDGVAVGAILALTFTEKAAAELRERIRRRFTELGEDEHARAVDAAWIGTIHGFCARRPARPPARGRAGPALRRARRGRGPARRRGDAFETALEDWTAAHGAAAVDVAAAYSRDLEAMVTSAHATLRSRGQSRPRLDAPAARGRRPIPAAAARRGGGRGRGDPLGAGNGARVTAALARAGRRPTG